jgi:hypothetical protein
MTVAAVDSVIPHVMFVAELHWLFPCDILIRHVRGACRRKNSKKRENSQENGRKDTKPRDEIRTTVKNLSHVSVALESVQSPKGLYLERTIHSYAEQRVSGSHSDPTVSNKTKQNATLISNDA